MEFMERESFLNNLDSLLGCAVALHSHASELWSQTCTGQPNLKKEQVRDLYGDDLLMGIVLGYGRFLSEIDPDSTISGYEREEFEVRSRIKMQNSIQQKLDRYMGMSHQGRVPVNKCFNDLFGIRVIANCRISHQEICGHIRETFGMKCIDSTKTDPSTGEPTYIATHVYLRGSNRDFPWELQIWLTENAEMNYTSHERYKQAYKEWDNRNGDMT